MGYTHYWYRSQPFTTNEWQLIKADVKKIIEYCQSTHVDLRYEYDLKRAPSVTNTHIQFNGVAELGHDTFYITKSLKYESWQDNSKPKFDFCKTARKPYDLAVCLCLLRIAHHSPTFRVSSDGGWHSDWMKARNVYQHLFNESTSSFSFGAQS